jgi:ABC-type branched-subunit amino acid transport system substrate-binding protein
MINEQGGINGRKITFISYDDAYSPPKTVEQARKLVEGDEVLLIFASLGTATNSSIMKYMNAKKVPQLFVATGGTKFGDPKHFPYTMGFQPNYQSEGRIYAKYIMQHHPAGKVAVLFQNDDYGKDVMKGLKDGLGPKASMIIAEAPYETAEPTVDSQIVQLKASGADIFVDIATPKFAAQAIKKVAELGWKPVHILNNVAGSIGSVLRPAGFENARNILSTAYFKDNTDPAQANDPGVKAFVAFMDKYYPEGDKTNSSNITAYTTARLMVQVLKQCGDTLTRENVMKQAANLKNVDLGMLLPGILVNTGPTDYFPLEDLQMRRFNGTGWENFGPIISGEIGGS